MEIGAATAALGTIVVTWLALWAATVTRADWRGYGKRTGELTEPAIIGVLILVALGLALTTPPAAPDAILDQVLQFALVSVATGYFVWIIYNTARTAIGQPLGRIAAIPLAARVGASGTLTILSFAGLFGIYGLGGRDPCAAFHALGVAGPCPGHDAVDFIYFAMVTFSTLGYGDFHPADGITQILAAALAIVGNLHLALIVGAFFALLTGPPE